MNTLERLKELAQQATPGPWEIERIDVGDDYACIVPSSIEGDGLLVVSDEGGLCPYDTAWETKTLEANAELITLSRNHVDSLIAVAEASKRVLNGGPDDVVELESALAKLEVEAVNGEGGAE